VTRDAPRYADRVTEEREPRVRWGWIAAVLVTGVLVLFVTGYNGADGSPFIGEAGVWVAWIAYVLLAAYGLWQGLRRR
jgi:drug/metabolite transporter (DMT)-like permease